MTIVLFLFLTHLGIGIALTFPLVGREAGVKFFRFNGGLAAILLAIGLALRPEGMAFEESAQGLALWAVAGAAAALTIYWATLGRTLPGIRPVLIWLWTVAGLVALAAHGVALATVSAWVPLAISSFVTSAALLGGTCTCMILGHWYLVIPSMDVALLQSIVKFHIASAVLRTGAVAAAVGAAVWAWGGNAAPDFARYALSSSGVFFWQRVLFGLAGPLVLAYLTWQTAKIRSTQSATGILYVDLFTVIVGEVLAKYLLLATGVPL